MSSFKLASIEEAYKTLDKVNLLSWLMTKIARMKAT